MSSGEKAKPPATFEERNPFDISRSSGPEVAAEIAKRMAAWKQARARTTPASTTTDPARFASATISSGDAKGRRRSPRRCSRRGCRKPRAGRSRRKPPPEARARLAPRVPYFAVSATRRAMPPAPSPKQARPPASGGDERAARADEPAIPSSAPVLEQAPQDQDQRPGGGCGDCGDDAGTACWPSPQSQPFPPRSRKLRSRRARASAPAQPELVRVRSPLESAACRRGIGTDDAEPTETEPSETERRRAEARALKARWIAARDLDALLERPAASAAADVAQSVEAAKTASRDAGTASARVHAAKSRSDGPRAPRRRRGCRSVVDGGAGRCFRSDGAGR